MTPITAFSQTEAKTFFRAIAGNWEGTLEYQDYAENKRVKLKTYLTVTPAADGGSAEFQTVYDDFGRIVKNRQVYKIDPASKIYRAGDSEYKIDSIETGKIVLSGSGQDGERVEPIRQTIAFDADNLSFLKETRNPWQFRNQTILRRASENVLAKKTFASARLQADFAVFKKAVKAMHPGIYRYQSEESLEKTFARYEARLKGDLPEADFFRLLAEVANRFYCGHTYLNPYNQKPLLRERLAGGKTYLPFYFRIIDGRIVVTENASAVNLARGSEILKINGVPARKIIETLLGATHADGTNTRAHRLKSLELDRFEAERYALFDWYFPLYFPLAGENYAIEAVDFATGKKTRFVAAAMTKEARTTEIERRYGKAPTYDDGWRFELWNDSPATAYLKIENSITWRLKKIDFKKFIADAFAAMRARGVENLILDLRGNGGGDAAIGFELARFLAKENLPPYLASRRLVRNVAPQNDLINYLDTYSDELKNILRTGVAPNLYKTAENGYFEILPNESVTNYPEVKPHENNFTGKTYIVSDAGNASAAFQFIDYAQKNRLGTIVGQPTGGSKQGINGGNYYFLHLPNSQIEIDIPVYFQSPLTPQKDEPVVPDVFVKRAARDVGDGFDRELAVIKELIRK
jgi:hypothetical protein